MGHEESKGILSRQVFTAETVWLQTSKCFSQTYLSTPPYHAEGAAVTSHINSCHIGSGLEATPHLQPSLPESVYFLDVLRLFSLEAALALWSTTLSYCHMQALSEAVSHEESLSPHHSLIGACIPSQLFLCPFDLLLVTIQLMWCFLHLGQIYQQ